MARRGGKQHLKRLNQPKVIQLRNRKEHTFLLNPSPGPHSKEKSIAIGVLLREVLNIASTAKEAKRILHEGKVLVDGRVVKDIHFPVGMMDIISFPEINKHYLLTVGEKMRLVPISVDGNALIKYWKVVRKYVRPGNKLYATLHDGRTISIDNHIKVGDTLVVDLKEKKLVKHLKLEPGAKCLIVEGKHAGRVVELQEIISRGSGRKKEAKLKAGGEEIITLADYLFVIDDDFRGVSNE
jgi:small subunit ribosomal protein S4e